MEENLSSTGSTGTTESAGSAPGSDTGSSTSTGAAQSSVDWNSFLSDPAGAPPDVVQKLLEAHPEVAKLATKTVRKTEVQKQAEALAEEFYKQRSGQTLSEFETVKRERDMLVTRQREALLSTMSDSEQEAFKLREALNNRDSELNYYKTVFGQREEAAARDQIIRTAREEWGFDDDDVKALDDANDIEKFIAKSLKLSGDKRKKMADETKTISEKLDALSRVVNGTSVHAATAHASSGGDASFNDLEQGYLDGNVSYERYMEAREKSLKR